MGYLLVVAAAATAEFVLSRPYNHAALTQGPTRSQRSS